MKHSRVVRWACQRASSSFSYHDSQSGVHVVIPAGVVLHPVSPASEVALFHDAGALVSVSAAETDPAVWKDAEAAVRRAKEQGSPSVRADLTSAFRLPCGGDIDPSDVQLASARLADAGCDILMLMDTWSTNHSTYTVDEDDVREALEACLYNDIVGMPMSARLGIRAQPSASDTDAWLDQVDEALHLNVRHYDVYLDGDRGPLYSAMSALLKKRGCDYELARL